MFRDRIDGGMKLAEKLQQYKGKKDVVVLAIPRGGVVTGNVVARQLGVPLDIIITKKIGHPSDPEYAVGAVGPKGDVFLTGVDVPKRYLEEEKARLKGAIDERYKKFRGDRPLPNLKNKVVILVDDGLATGSTMMAAIKFVEKESPKKIVVAVPVAPAEAIGMLERYADVVCVHVPDMFYAIGSFYGDFPEVRDEEAIKLLEEA